MYLKLHLEIFYFFHLEHCLIVIEKRVITILQDSRNERKFQFLLHDYLMYSK